MKGWLLAVLCLAGTASAAEPASQEEDAISRAWRVLRASEDPQIVAVRTLLAERARVQPLAREPGTTATDSRVAQLERQVQRLEAQVRELRSELFRVRSRM